ncbi:MAG: GtrA family protein [Patescibacteria group bacterium]
MINLKRYYNSIVERIRFLPFAKDHPWIRQFFKFSVVGGTCMILDFLIYIFLTRLFSFWQNHLAWANFLSICLSATVNFVWNKKWTFRDKDQKIFWQYIKFWVVVIGGLILYQLIFIFSVQNLKLYDLLSKAIAAIIVWILRFIFNKFWTFRAPY